MMGLCDYCKLYTRINKKTKFCAPCLRNFQATVEKHFDGNPLLPLEMAANHYTELELDSVLKRKPNGGLE